MLTERLYQKFWDLNFFGLNVALEFMIGLAAVIALYYAARSFRAARRQNELSTVPHLLFESEKHHKINRLVLVSNSNKLAYNFHIDKLYRFMESEKWQDAQVSKYEFKFDPVEGTDGKRRNFLSGKGERIPVKVYQDGIELDDDFASWLFTNHLKVGQFRVRFIDSQNLKYYTDIVFDRGGASRIKQAPRRLSWARRIIIAVQSGGYRLVVFRWRLKIAYHRLFN